MADLLQFPAQHVCPTCNRPCGQDELSECLRCGRQYCKHDDWTCQCDRDAADILSRAGVSLADGVTP